MDTLEEGDTLDCAPVVRLGELNCNDLALVMTGTCCLGRGDCLLLRTGEEPVSGERMRGCCGNGCSCLDAWGFGLLPAGFCTGDARIGLLPEAGPRDITDTGDEVLDPPRGDGTAFMLSTFLTAIVGFAKVVMLLALSMMSLD